MVIDIRDNAFRFNEEGFDGEKLHLLNGNILKCVAGKGAATATDKETQTDFLRFFAQNAFFLLKNADKIFADSRMFLSPIPVESGLAYVGNSGFCHPVLGAYLEWWLHGNGGRVTDHNGKERLVLKVSGSPLSGVNTCPATDAEGNIEHLCMRPFSTVCHSFIQHNQRYKAAKCGYEAYALEEVVKRLRAEQNP